MTRTGLSIAALSGIIVIVLTKLFPLVMGIIIVVAVFSLIVFTLLERNDHEEMGN